MKCLIYGQYWNNQDEPFVRGLFSELSKRDIAFAIYEPYAKQIPISLESAKTIGTYKDLKSYAPDFIITLGGDGTILSAVSLIADLEIPIMGINLGRLGFLASIEQERISTAIENIVDRKFSISQRNMLKVKSSPDIFGKSNFALNDFTLLKRDNSAMVVIHAYVDDQFLNSYWADGLIVSTATGSTGYSLSCGGPIVFPTADTFVLTPVAPHNLNVRPIIISGDSSVRLKIEGRAENYLCTLDSRNEIISSNYEIQLQRNDFSTRLIVLEGDNFMKTIRHKLNWGLDKRNYDGRNQDRK